MRLKARLLTPGYIPLPPDPAEPIQAIIFQADHQIYQSLDFRHLHIVRLCSLEGDCSAVKPSNCLGCTTLLQVRQSQQVEGAER
jgi:hypothetical protein